MICFSFIFNLGGRRKNNMTKIFYNLGRYGGSEDIINYINRRIKEQGYCSFQNLINYFKEGIY
jgi:hypothetical protein